MAFYRYRAPTWFNANAITPATAVGTPQENGSNYFFLNVDDLGAGGAPEDGQVLSGPSQYTFMVAFGEDATSGSVNRGLAALAENTDALDDIANKDRIRPVRTLFTVVGSPSNTVQVPLEAYMGNLGASLTATHLQALFRVCDTSGRELYSYLDEQVVLVQSCSPGTSPYYCDGVYTLTLNSFLEPGTYALLHYTRDSFAMSTHELLRTPFLESLCGISGYLQLQLAFWRGDSQAWDALPPPATLFGLKNRTLDGVYSGQANGGTLSLPADLSPFYPLYDSGEPGSGGAYVRNGPSMVAVSTFGLGTAPSSSTPWLRDPLGGMWTSYVADVSPQSSASAFKFVGLSRGFVHVGHRIRSKNNVTMPAKAPALASFAAYIEHADEYSDTSQAPTYIELPRACILQRVAGEDLLTITSFSYWFYKSFSGTDRTSLVLGLTLLEVEWANPSDPITADPVRRIYRIVEFKSPVQVEVMGPDGGPVEFPAGTTAATITRIFTPTFLAPDGAGDFRDALGSTNASLLESGPLMALTPPGASFAVADAVPTDAAYVGAAYALSTSRALEWGGFEDRLNQAGAGTYRRLGSLRGDGSIYPTNIVASLGTITTLTVTTATVTTINASDGTFTGTLTASAGAFTFLQATAAEADVLTQKQLVQAQDSVNVSGTLSVTLSGLSTNQVARVVSTGSTVLTTILLPGTFLSPGKKFEIVFDQTSAEAQISNFSTTWPSSFKFENPTDKFLSQRVGAIDRYICKAISATVVQVTVERTYT